MENEKNEIMIVTELREEYNKAIAEIENVLSVYDKALLDIEKDILNSSKERLINKINEAADEMSDTDIRQYKFFLANEMKNCNLISTKYMVEDNGIAINQVNKKVNKLNKEVDAVINSQIEILNNEEDILSYAQENNQLAKKGNRALRVVLALGGVTLLASLIAHAVSCSKGNNVVVTEINTDNDHKIESTITSAPIETITPAVDTRMTYEELNDLIDIKVAEYINNGGYGEISSEDYRTALEIYNEVPSKRIITIDDVILINDEFERINDYHIVNKYNENEGIINTPEFKTDFRYSDMVLDNEQVKATLVRIEDLTDTLVNSTDENLKRKAADEIMIIAYEFGFKGYKYDSKEIYVMHSDKTKADMSDYESIISGQISSDAHKLLIFNELFNAIEMSRQYDSEAYIVLPKELSYVDEEGKEVKENTEAAISWANIMFNINPGCTAEIEEKLIKVIKTAYKDDIAKYGRNNYEEYVEFQKGIIKKLNVEENIKDAAYIAMDELSTMDDIYSEDFNIDETAESIIVFMKSRTSLYTNILRGIDSTRQRLDNQNIMVYK